MSEQLSLLPLYKIKPLKWEHPYEGTYRAETTFIYFTIHRRDGDYVEHPDGAKWRVEYYVAEYYDDDEIGFARTLKEAKEIAWRYYLERLVTLLQEVEEAR